MYEWAGCNPLPPEFWLFPSFLPYHPGNLLTERTIYLLVITYEITIWLHDDDRIKKKEETVGNKDDLIVHICNVNSCDVV